MDPQHLTAVRDHLQSLVESPVLNRAPAQVKALAAMVDAACEGREQSGADLAQAVYGRADESYVRAVRQLARELRLKLPLAYEAGRHYPMRFELHPHHYAVRIVVNGAAAVIAEPIAPEVILSPEPPRPRIAFRVGIAVLAVTVGLGAIGAIAWNGRGTPRLVAPARIETSGGEVTFLDASGKPLTGWRERVIGLGGFQSRETAPGWGMHEWADAVILEEPPGIEPRLAAVTCDPFTPGLCALHLLAADGGRELSRLDLPKLPSGVAKTERLHEEEGETFVPDWVASSIDRADRDGDGVRDEIIVALRSRRLFPTQILGLDYDGSWRVLADYWNMGTADAVALPDLDGDGRDEILAYGENNSYQRGFVTVLPSAIGFPIGARSPDGYRLARIAEVERYPYGGVTFQFPFTDLARDQQEKRLRNPVMSVQWDRREAALNVSVEDAATNPETGERWQVAFRLTSGATPSSAFMIEYDSAFSRLRSLIAEGRLEDRWNVESSQRLTDYGRELASRIQVWDAREPKPAWRPIRNGELGSVFPRAQAAVTASAR